MKSPGLKQPSLISVAGSEKAAMITDKIDIEKIHNFVQKIRTTCKLDKPFDLVLTLIDNVKMFTGC